MREHWNRSTPLLALSLADLTLLVQPASRKAATPGVDADAGRSVAVDWDTCVLMKPTMCAILRVDELVQEDSS